MTAHPQSSPRGTIAKKRVDIGAQQLTDGTTFLGLNNGIKVSGLAGGLLTADANQLILPGGVKVSGAAGGALTADASNLILPGGVKISNAAGGILTADASNLVLPGGIKISNAAGGIVTASASATIFPLALQLTKTSVAPATRVGPGALRMVSNSTGKMVALNTTGTTWVYLNVTSALA